MKKKIYYKPTSTSVAFTGFSRANFFCLSLYLYHLFFSVIGSSASTPSDNQGSQNFYLSRREGKRRRVTVPQVPHATVKNKILEWTIFQKKNWTIFGFFPLQNYRSSSTSSARAAASVSYFDFQVAASPLAFTSCLSRSSLASDSSSNCTRTDSSSVSTWCKLDSSKERRCKILD